jgi:hypothetical protein
MSDYDAFFASVHGLAVTLHSLNQRAVREYGPVVEAIIRSRSRDAGHIEHTLDGLLDFCGHEPALRLYRRLCRHYFDIDPRATADYVNAYREIWDFEARQEIRDTAGRKKPTGARGSRDGQRTRVCAITRPSQKGSKPRASAPISSTAAADCRGATRGRPATARKQSLCRSATTTPRRK